MSSESIIIPKNSISFFLISTLFSEITIPCSLESVMKVFLNYFLDLFHSHSRLAYHQYILLSNLNNQIISYPFFFGRFTGNFFNPNGITNHS